MGTVRSSLSTAARSEPWLLAAILAAAALASISPALATWCLGTLTSRAADNTADLRLSSLPALGLAATAGISVLAPAAGAVLSERLRGRLRIKETNDLLTRLNFQSSVTVFESSEFNAELSLARQRGILASGQVVTATIALAQATGLSVGFLVLLRSLSTLLALAAVGAAALLSLLEIALTRRRVQAVRLLNDLGREEFLYTQSIVGYSEARQLRLLQLGDFLRHRTIEQSRRQLDVETRLGRAELAVRACSALAAIALVVGALAIGINTTGNNNPADLVVAAVAAAGVVQATSSAIATGGSLLEAQRVERMYRRFIATLPTGPTDGEPVGRLRRGISLEGVDFAYPGASSLTLQGVRCEILADELTVIVGANGSGKSTLAKLLCGLYPASSGTITWDDRDITLLDPAALRSRMSYVFQDFVTYELSARENIGVGQLPLADCDTAITSAAIQADADGMLDRLPRGYDTRLTRLYPDPTNSDDSNGHLLSGGQEQRLALARAFMRLDADLLVLDEPASNLDPAAERQLVDTIQTARDGLATVVITHRLSTARIADRILVLNGGTISEAGTHDELMSKDGEYAKLFTLQASVYQTHEAEHQP